jgi:hypothetical protein
MPASLLSDPLSVKVRVDGGERVSVEFSRHLRRYELQTADGASVGQVVGYLIRSANGPNLTVNEGQIIWKSPRYDLPAFEMDVIGSLQGAFLAVAELGGALRLYTDASSQIPIVYDASRRLAGCSANDLLSDADYHAALRQDRVSKLVVREGKGGWIPGTLTAHEGVKRLLPNHYLDLRTFASERFWPSPDFRHHRTSEEAAAIAGAALRSFILACAEQTEVCGTLTAGFDTRVLLAASKPVVDRMPFVTFVDGPPGLDQVRAGELARRFDLDLRFIPVVEASEDEQRRWDRLVGHCVYEVNRRIHPTLAEIPGELVFTGLFGVSGRSSLYKRDYHIIDESMATPESIIQRLALPYNEDVAVDLAAWLAPIQHLPHSTVLDLAYTELRFGSWAMAQSPAQKSVRMSLSPMGQRVVQDAFMSVAPNDKQDKRLFTALARANWPEAMELPVNRYGDYRDKLSLVRKLLDVARVRRAIRRRLAVR